MNTRMQTPVRGAIAGFAATVPMTAAMSALYHRLPEREQYPLPPREITEEIVERVGAGRSLDADVRSGLTLGAHFAYGALCGALYAPIARALPLPRVVSGVLFGLIVWTVSYLGWLPAARILPSATDQPKGRNALMIAAHVVWGASLGLLLARITAWEQPRRRGVPFL